MVSGKLVQLHVSLNFFTKGNNFCGILLAFLDKVSLPERFFSVTKEFAPKAANSFF